MKEVILLKNGELTLKGLNKSTFEAMLVKNIKYRLKGLGGFRMVQAQSTITVEPEAGMDLGGAVARLQKVCGIAAISRAAACEKDFNVIRETAKAYLSDELLSAKTFKVEAKRADKKFPLTSPEISRELGGTLLQSFPHLAVDVADPDIRVAVEIRDNHAFIRGSQMKGAGGMPSGSAGRAALLISGGIDSPVAGYMMAKRGLSLTAVHFASPPYTSALAQQKVEKLLAKVAEYSGRISLFTVPFTEIQESIRDNCREDYFTIIMRRAMMKIASEIAVKDGCAALITGESLGQVASQTIGALGCTDAAASMPVFRPLIGMDKNEIIEISRKIETFDISILPYEDCCTVFTPKHPKTRPFIDEAEREEEKACPDELIGQAVSKAECKYVF
ncbi:MAG: tRNA 4-thiouridine(8) synthase ThiI [Oscillospiraceae bacterium]|nr:tRNA 4-thiouridine(8) synthase ThiI [Oscillospiraceae bacterium]